MKERQILRMRSLPQLIKGVQLSFLILCISSISLFAQQDKTITGKVTSETGETLPGVTVMVKGTTTGTVTNMDGNYTLKVSEKCCSPYFFLRGDAFSGSSYR